MEKCGKPPEAKIFDDRAFHDGGGPGEENGRVKVMGNPTSSDFSALPGKGGKGEGKGEGNCAEREGNCRVNVVDFLWRRTGGTVWGSVGNRRQQKKQ